MFTITGLSDAWATAANVSLSNPASETVTVAGSGTTYGAGGSLFTVARGDDNKYTFTIYNAALSSGRGTIKVSNNTAGASLISGLSFAGTLGQSATVGDKGGFSVATTGGSFLYTAPTYDGYYTLNGTISSTGASSVSAAYYAGTGGEQFQFYGLSSGNVSGFGSASALEGAFTVTSTSSFTNGSFSITGYTFEIGSGGYSLLGALSAGNPSLSVGVTGAGVNGSASTISLTIASALSATGFDSTSTLPALESGKVFTSANHGYSATVEVKDDNTLNYSASITSYQWYDAKGASVTFNPTVDGYGFTLSGISAGSLGGSGAYALADNNVLTVGSGSGTIIGSVSVRGTGGTSAYVYLTKNAFTGDADKVIYFTDGAGDSFTYSLSYADTNNATYLPKYGESVSDAKLESVGSTSVYNFTASGFGDGITISGNSATFTASTSLAGFSIAGLATNLSLSSKVVYDATKGTFINNAAGTSVINVAPIGTGGTSYTVTIYDDALSSTADGRSDISLTNFANGSFSLALGLSSDYSYSGTGTPKVVGSSISTVKFTGGTSTWTSTKYHDYYTLENGNAPSKATHYAQSGGHSFTFSIADSTATQTGFTGSLSVFETYSQSAGGTAGQFGVSSITFGASLGFLNGIEQGNKLTVSTTEGNNAPTYGFSFLGTTSTIYSNEVKNGKAILTEGVSAAASITGATGGFSFWNTIDNYAYFSLSSDSHSIEHVAQAGGQPFTISGLSNFSSGSLSFNKDNNTITFGNTTIASIAFGDVPEGGGSRMGYVYLTEAALSLATGSNSVAITLTDSDMTDDVNYALSFAAAGDSTYIAERGKMQLATIADIGDGSYIYYAGTQSAGVVFTDSVVGGSDSQTSFTYYKTVGGESFAISGFVSGLGLSADASGNITSTANNNAVVGSVSTTGAVLFTNTLVLGTVSEGASAAFGIKDETDDDVTYSLSLSGTFNFLNKAPSALGEGNVQVIEDAANKVYNVTAGGTPAYSLSNASLSNQFVYHAGQSIETYSVTGLATGLSTAAQSAIFQAKSVSLFAYALPEGVANISITNNTASATFAPQSGSISNAQWSISDEAAIANGTFSAATYMPWYNDASFSAATASSITIYPQVGGQSFTLTNFASGLSLVGTGSGAFDIKSGSSVVGTITTTASESAIEGYTFTITGRSGLATTLTNGGTISVVTNDAFDGEYTFTITDEAGIRIGMSAANAAVSGATLTYNETYKVYSYQPNTRPEYVEAGSDSRSYTYAGQSKPSALVLNGTFAEGTSLGKGISIAETWTANGLSALNVTLSNEALKGVSQTEGTSIKFTNAGSVSVAFALDGVSAATVYKEGFTEDTNVSGSYAYTTAGNSEGYQVSDDKTYVSYTAATTPDTFTVYGLSSGLSLGLSGTTVWSETLGASVGTFASNTLTITSASALAAQSFAMTNTETGIKYKLSLADGVGNSITSAKVTKAITNDNPIQYTASQSAYYTEAENGNQYNYHANQKQGEDFSLTLRDVLLARGGAYTYALAGSTITITPKGGTALSLAEVDETN